MMGRMLCQADLAGTGHVQEFQILSLPFSPLFMLLLSLITSQILTSLLVSAYLFVRRHSQFVRPSSLV